LYVERQTKIWIFDMTDEADLPAYARNLQRLTQQAGMRQSDVALRAGIARDAFGRYYHGHNRPPPLKTAAIARVLGCLPYEIDPGLPPEIAPGAAGALSLLAPRPPLTGFNLGPAKGGDPEKMRIFLDADIPAADALKILSILSGQPQQ
jgi:transcriptional regulator with XRE-family HTH domain